ncbi:MAG: hypothetical protein ACLGHZ_10695 [Actinomycetes bacterium]
MTTFPIPTGRHVAPRPDPPWASWSILLPLVAVLILIWLAAAVQVLPMAGDADHPVVPVPRAQAAPQAPGR